MGTAEQASNEIIHYFPQTWDFLGEFMGGTLRMQTIYMSWLTVAIVLVLVLLATHKRALIPGRAQVVMESIVEWLGSLMEDSMGKEGRRIFGAFIVTLFLYIFVGNELGLLPQVGVHLTSPTNDINVAFGLSLMVMALKYIVGIYRHGLGYFKHFVKPFAVFLPLNIVEELASPVTMALRLFGNILAGEILLIVLYMLAPWVVPELWVMFSLFIGALQAFIFTMLTIIAFGPIFREEH